ncbi:hypothetical protein PYCCODRAFT_17068 [Trametes coccinea BRFM310]|uniref:Uncharacterized protein n=1 Tax=Trametes coccinea (strain BRFM310) TaxID=1353009 RepID=A0A1Y2J4S5_TRAC3|nr:hypothetical protein PYCCODRAFT_17068 [Trametes coccinea BRFM310]
MLGSLRCAEPVVQWAAGGDGPWPDDTCKGGLCDQSRTASTASTWLFRVPYTLEDVNDPGTMEGRHPGSRVRRLDAPLGSKSLADGSCEVAWKIVRSRRGESELHHRNHGHERLGGKIDGGGGWGTGGREWRARSESTVPRSPPAPQPPILGPRLPLIIVKALWRVFTITIGPLSPSINAASY